MDVSALILAVDTATPNGGVCLMRGDHVVTSIAGEANLSHSNTLLRDIEAALHASSISLQEIDLFAVAAGPGSFTGLRIGLATIKALSATLDRPCIGVPTLQAVARAAGVSEATVALLPAGRGELFAQLLSVSLVGDVTERDAPVHLAGSAIVEKYAALRDLTWAGTGAHVHRDLLREQAQRAGAGFDESGAARSGWKLAKKNDNLAVEIAAIARHRQRIGASGAAETLRALYVRPSDPELKECR